MNVDQVQNLAISLLALAIVIAVLMRK